MRLPTSQNASEAPNNFDGAVLIKLLTFHLSFLRFL